MSMRDYAVDDYGMVLDAETAKTICLNLWDDYDGEDYEDYGYDLYSHEKCEYISEFTGEAYKIDDNGDIFGASDSYDCESLYYISLWVYPSLFNKAYNSMDDIVAELKERIGKYLPEDFDYRSKIRHIIGTYYG